jgi:hypothetical protein
MIGVLSNPVQDIIDWNREIFDLRKALTRRVYDIARLVYYKVGLRLRGVSQEFINRKAVKRLREGVGGFRLARVHLYEDGMSLFAKAFQLHRGLPLEEFQVHQRWPFCGKQKGDQLLHFPHFSLHQV